MRLVLDTNVFISALLVSGSAPANLLALWRRGKLIVVSAAEQIEELAAVLRYPKIQSRLGAGLAGRLINELREMAEMVEPLPVFDVSRDPFDDYLLGIASAGSADYLITGDKNHLLSLRKYRGTKILTIRQFFSMTGLSQSAF
ncbi:MAG: putative toxin-antitoxin system toxin component, PIN family [Rhodomicrobium sp.]